MDLLSGAEEACAKAAHLGYVLGLKRAIMVKLPFNPKKESWHVERLDSKESNGSLYCQVFDLMRVMCGKRDMWLFKHQRGMSNESTLCKISSKPWIAIVLLRYLRTKNET